MILRAHHAALRVADPEEAAARWGRLYGLTRSDADGAVLLRCAYEDFCLELRPAEGPGHVEHVAYELRSGVSLDEAADRVRTAGGEASQVEVPVRGAGLRTADPDGNGIVLVERVITEDRVPPVARYTDELPGFHPRRLQHFNYLTADVPRLAEFYERALGPRDQRLDRRRRRMDARGP